jgi:Zn-dependent peptidase ImmA (M78 family)
MLHRTPTTWLRTIRPCTWAQRTKYPVSLLGVIWRRTARATSFPPRTWLASRPATPRRALPALRRSSTPGRRVLGREGSGTGRSVRLYNVKFLPAQQIERDALGLLEAYFHDLGQPIQIPIPADEILETHLGLSLDFDDLQTVLGVPDVLGALWADRREVFIDQSLEPESHPEMEGRYNFSVAHEAGHWQLHRKYLLGASTPPVMFRQDPMARLMICRSLEVKARIELQADLFAASLLMPRELVLHAWETKFKCRKPYQYDPRHWRDVAARLERPRIRHVRLVMQDAYESRSATLRWVFRDVAEYFAPQFRVSTQAMQIRLEDLGLLKIAPSDQRRRAAGS